MGKEEMVSEETIQKVRTMAEVASNRNILFLKTKSIFLFDSKTVVKDILKDIPQLEKVEIQKKFFNQTLTISLNKKRGVALWCREERCFLLDKEGIIFEENSSEKGLIKIENLEFADELVLGESVIEKAKLAQIMAIKSKLAEVAKISASKAVLVSLERLNIQISEGWEIYFNLKGDLDWQIQELNVVLEKQISSTKRRNLQYIDLRFSRVYYK